MVVIRGGVIQEIVIILQVIIDEVVLIMGVTPTEIVQVMNVFLKRKVLVVQLRSIKIHLPIQILGITVIAIVIPNLINVLFSYC